MSATITAFLTDSTLCIGCKACEVACKEWNGIADDGFNWTGNSYDNTGAGRALDLAAREVRRRQAPSPASAATRPTISRGSFLPTSASIARMAGCLEACPTGRIVRTEFGGVFVQPDVCNGCGYCVVACPFGVVQRNPDDGRAFKCTFCYDRQKVGLKPACAKACPTESIKFGPLDQLADRCRRNAWRSCKPAAWTTRSVYDPQDTSVGGIHAFFIVRGDPRQYNLPPNPEVPTTYLQGRVDQLRRRCRTAAVRQRLFAFLGSAKR